MVAHPLPVIPGVHRVAVEWSGGSGGLTATNVMHFRREDLAFNAAELMTAINDNVDRTMWNTMADTWIAIALRITPLDGASPTLEAAPTTPADWGGNTGGDVAPQVASVLKITTAVRGRANRGRLFLPAPSEAQTSFGRLIDGSEATATAAWGTFAENMIANPPHAYKLGVAAYDRRHFGAAAHFNPAVALAFEQELATQRRRQSRLRGA